LATFRNDVHRHKKPCKIHFCSWQALSLNTFNGLQTLSCRLIKLRRDANVGGSTREGPPTLGCGERMKNSGKHVACMLLTGLIFLAGPLACGQESTTVPSLGEVARRLKAERERQKQKPVAVFTNGNLPSRVSLGIASVNLEKGTKEKAQTNGKGSAETTASRDHGENYFRSKANRLRSQMEFHRRQLAVLKQQMGIARMQYYPNPQKTLEQESSPAFQKDIDKLRARIAKAEKAVANDQEAMEDLQQELRQERGDPGWIR
jgi:hypothetical protein